MIPNIISSSHIQLKYIFGINNSWKKNLYFKDEHFILYPAGYQIVSYNTEEKTQSYYHGLEGYRGFSCMTVSPSKRYLAVGAKGDKPVIFIFDTMTQKKKKTLDNLPEGNIKEWVALAFAPGSENKHLISLSGGGGDVILCYWQYDKTKNISIKISQSQILATELAFNPNDTSFISICGSKVFKTYRLAENTEDSANKTNILKALSQQIAGAPTDLSNNYSCHCWLTVDSKVVVGTDGGEILCLSNLCEFEEVLKNSPTNLLKNSWNIHCITSYSKGFIIGGDFCQVFIYKYFEDGDGMKKWDVTHQMQAKQITDFKEIHIRSIAISPNLEEKLACNFSNNTIYSVKLKSDLVDILDAQEYHESFEPISLNFHIGQINSMDISIRKPLIATCGADKYIRIWNYEEKTLECQRAWPEEPQSISIHPNGFHLAVGFTDKIRLMNIIIHNSQIKNYGIIPFKSCKEIKFSNGGQFLAVVNGTSANNQTISIFNTYTGETCYFLKGHNARVRCLLWSRDDTVLVSCGADGMIFSWTIGYNNDITKQNWYTKAVNFTSVSITSDNRTIIGAGHSSAASGSNERFLKEYSIDGSSENRRDQGLSLIISQTCFPTSNKILFAGICDENKNSGSIFCYKYPFTGYKVEYQAHDEKGIEKMRVTNDDQYIITAGRDGCIMIFEIKDKEARGMKLKEGFSKNSDEILITKVDLDNIVTQKEQNDQYLLDQKQSQNSTTMKDDLIKQLQEKLMNISQNNIKSYQNLLESKQDLEKKYEEDLKNMTEQFENELQELDTTYQKRVMQEVAKYEDSKKHQGILNSKYDKEMKAMENAHKKKKKQVEDEYHAMLEEERNLRERITREKEDKKKEYDENIRQIENETEEEIENLKEKNGMDTLMIQEQGLSAKSEVSLTKKRIMALQAEAQDKEEQRKECEDTKATCKQQNMALKAEIELQKAKIQEKDKTIGEKENRISELKKKSQELERFKFVLDHKIKELKRDIVPREDAISKMKDQTNDMDQKLKTFNELNNQLGDFVNRLDSIQGDLNLKIKKLRSHISYQNVKIKQFKDDIYKAVQYIQNYPELKNQTTILFQTYSTQDIKAPEIDPDIDAEYKSQKKYLQKSVAMLKKNLEKDKEIHKQDNLRIMKENVNLIREINQLRKKIRDIKYPQKGNDQQEKKNISPTEKFDSRLDFKDDENKSNAELKKILELQTKQIEDLKKKLEETLTENELFKK